MLSNIEINPGTYTFLNILKYPIVYSDFTCRSVVVHTRTHQPYIEASGQDFDSHSSSSREHHLRSNQENILDIYMYTYV